MSVSFYGDSANISKYGQSVNTNGNIIFSTKMCTFALVVAINNSWGVAVVIYLFIFLFFHFLLRYLNEKKYIFSHCLIWPSLL